MLNGIRLLAAGLGIGWGMAFTILVLISLLKIAGGKHNGHSGRANYWNNSILCNSDTIRSNKK